MATGRAQEEQGGVTEESCTALSTASDDVPPRAILECHICKDAPTSPVASSCGHVFCWPCLNEWLENSVKPCPVCRKLLTTTVHVLSLHDDVGNVAARASHSNDDIANEAEPLDHVIFAPPRPANPFSFVPRESSASPESEASVSMAIVRAVRELYRERSRGRSLALERARQKPELKQRNIELLQRTSELKQEKKRMGLYIAELERRLALANEQLRSGGTDRCRLPSDTSASEPPRF